MVQTFLNNHEKHLTTVTSPTNDTNMSLYDENHNKLSKDEMDEVLDMDSLTRVYSTRSEISPQSRLQKEFGIIKSIGKGGFGEVLKVLNFLDKNQVSIFL